MKDKKLREISAYRDYYIFIHNFRLFQKFNKQIAYRTKERVP